MGEARELAEHWGIFGGNFDRVNEQIYTLASVLKDPYSL
jgi:hypothetical protein